jgi:hypothetical protein
MSLFITTLQDATEERFVRLEEKVVDISRNMALLMVALVNKFGPLGRLVALTQKLDWMRN